MTFSETVELRGHIIDSYALPQIMDEVIRVENGLCTNSLRPAPPLWSYAARSSGSTEERIGVTV